jgi:hypothetical protein
MRSLAALLVLAASLGGSLVALPALADEPGVTVGEAPKPPAAPAPAPPVAPVPGPYAVPYYVAPPWWALPPRVTERRSKAMMNTGIVLWGVGGVVTGVGVGLFVIAESAGCAVPDFAGGTPTGSAGAPKRRGESHRGAGESLGTARQALSLCGDPSAVNLGLGVLAAGALGSGAGIPLFVLGNQKQPVKRATDALEAPVLRVGAGSAELRWSF